jgi:hypothetical protein
VPKSRMRQEIASRPPHRYVISRSSSLILQQQMPPRGDNGTGYVGQERAHAIALRVLHGTNRNQSIASRSLVHVDRAEVEGSQSDYQRDCH